MTTFVSVFSFIFEFLGSLFTRTVKTVGVLAFTAFLGMILFIGTIAYFVANILS